MGELEERSGRREDDRNEVWYWLDKISEKNLKTGMDYRPDRILKKTKYKNGVYCKWDGI